MSLLPRLGSLGQRRYDPNANPDEIVGIDQQRRLAAALQQDGLQSPQGQMISGHYVPASWTQQLAQGLKLGAGAYIDEQANNQQRDYNSARTKKFADILSGNKSQQISGAPVQTSTMPAYTPEQQDRFGSPLQGVERQPVVSETIPMQQETPTQVNERIQPEILEYIQKYGNTPEAQYLLGQMNKQDDRAYAKGEKLEDRAYADNREEKLYNRGRSDKLSDIDAERKYQDIVRKDQQGFQVSQQDRQFEQAYKMQAQNQNFTAGQSQLNRDFQAGQNDLSRQITLSVAQAKEGGAAKLSPTAQKEVFEADDIAQGSANVIGALNAAKELNKNSYSGYGAKGRAQLRSNLPGSSVEADNTIQLDNLMTGQALESLKATFGAAPTEGERKILLDIQASADKTPEQRADIINRAISAAERRQQSAINKGKSLRSGTYFTDQPAIIESPGASGGWGIQEIK